MEPFTLNSQVNESEDIHFCSLQRLLTPWASVKKPCFRCWTVMKTFPNYYCLCEKWGMKQGRMIIEKSLATHPTGCSAPRLHRWLFLGNVRFDPLVSLVTRYLVCYSVRYNVLTHMLNFGFVVVQFWWNLAYLHLISCSSTFLGGKDQKCVMLFGPYCERATSGRDFLLYPQDSLSVFIFPLERWCKFLLNLFCPATCQCEAT